MDKFISVATFPNEMQALVAQATLSAAEIESYIKIDDAGGMIPALEQSGGVKLLVDEKMLEEAKTVLATSPEQTEP